MRTGGSGFHRSLWTVSRLALAAMILAGIAALAAFQASAVAAADPTIAAAGDYGCDPLDPHYNNLDGTPNGAECQQKATSNLLVNGHFSAVLALGDQHYCGSLAEYQQAYDPTWGRVKSITHPIPGNHEYLTAGGSTPTTGCDSSNAGAAGYFTYFGSAAGTPGQGWYSYDIGAWHLIALNSNCSDVGGCIPSSPQGLWLAADLAAHQNQCILAYWHIPLFSSGGRAAQNSYWLWQQLYAAHADVVLDGHDHIYERFDPQDANGVADPNGIREFIVGTGGANHTSIATVAANSVVRDTTTFGVLALTLHSSGYSWGFEPAVGTFTDSGSASCHNTGPHTEPKRSAERQPRQLAAPRHSTRWPTVTWTHRPRRRSTGRCTSLQFDGSPVVRSYLRFNVSENHRHRGQRHAASLGQHRSDNRIRRLFGRGQYLGGNQHHRRQRATIRRDQARQLGQDHGRHLDERQRDSRDHRQRNIQPRALDDEQHCRLTLIARGPLSAATGDRLVGLGVEQSADEPADDPAHEPSDQPAHHSPDGDADAESDRLSKRISGQRHDHSRRRQLCRHLDSNVQLRHADAGPNRRLARGPHIPALHRGRNEWGGEVGGVACLRQLGPDDGL